MVNFLLKQENFEKMNKAIQAKRPWQESKDIDSYNNAVKDFNTAVEKVNAMHNDHRQKRSAFFATVEQLQRKLSRQARAQTQQLGWHPVIFVPLEYYLKSCLSQDFYSFHHNYVNCSGKRNHFYPHRKYLPDY